MEYGPKPTTSPSFSREALNVNFYMEFLIFKILGKPVKKTSPGSTYGPWATGLATCGFCFIILSDQEEVTKIQRKHSSIVWIQS